METKRLKKEVKLATSMEKLTYEGSQKHMSLQDYLLQCCLIQQRLLNTIGHASPIVIGVRYAWRRLPEKMHTGEMPRTRTARRPCPPLASIMTTTAPDCAEQSPERLGAKLR